MCIFSFCSYSGVAQLFGQACRLRLRWRGFSVGAERRCTRRIEIGGEPFASVLRSSMEKSRDEGASCVLLDAAHF
jgi:hypothetical protein